MGAELNSNTATVVRYFLLFTICILMIISFNGQTEVGDNTLVFSDKDIFDSEDLLNCSLTFDIRTFRKEKFSDEKIEAILSYHVNDSISIHKDIYIKARGVSRKTICYFPPIKLKLKKPAFDSEYQNQVENLKLVTHCKSSESFNQYLLKEYLIYKLYNVISDKSFRVRLMNMNYIDSEEKVKTLTRYAFIIENTKAMAAYNECTVFKSDNLVMKDIEPSSMIQLSVFQFMIGNVDWSITGLHNIKLIKSTDYSQTLPYPVPYDFDYAGFVNAPYAVNVLDPEIQSVKERMFVGRCYTENEYAEILQKFILKRSKVYTTIKDFELLDSKIKKELIMYIDEFYKLIEQPDFYNNYVIHTCKK